MKKYILISILLLSSCGGNSNTPNILLSPKETALDSVNNRLFVVDSSNNNLSLINVSDNSIVGGAPLLNNDSALRFVQTPQDIAVQNMGGGLSRIFILGSSTTYSNQISVFDYDTSSGLRAASFNPILVGHTSTDELGGLAIDSTNNRLFVSNSTQALLYAFSTQDGSSQIDPPLAISSLPARMSLNTTLSRLFISSLGSNSVSIVHTDDLTASVENLEIGTSSSSIASCNNSNGSALGVVSPSKNEILLYHLNSTTLSASTLINPPVLPNQTGVNLSATEPLSGAASEILCTKTEDEKIVFFISQSTGDLGSIDINANFSAYSTGRISVANASAASGLQILNNSSGVGISAYIAAPNGSTLSIIDLTQRTFSTQLF